MKKLILYFVPSFLVLMAFAGCQFDAVDPDLEPVPDQEYLYYGRYLNFAWGRSDHGFVVSSDGWVHTFNVVESGEAWSNPNETGIYSPGTFESNMELGRTDNIEEVNNTWLNDHPKAIVKVNEAELPESKAVMVDAGTIAFYVLRKDEEGNYHEYLVGVRGDEEVTREGWYSHRLLNWLYSTYEVFPF